MFSWDEVDETDASERYSVYDTLRVKRPVYHITGTHLVHLSKFWCRGEFWRGRKVAVSHVCMDEFVAWNRCRMFQHLLSSIIRTRASNWIKSVRLIGCAQKQNKERQLGHYDHDILIFLCFIFVISATTSSTCSRAEEISNELGNDEARSSHQWPLSCN